MRKITIDAPDDLTMLSLTLIQQSGKFETVSCMVVGPEKDNHIYRDEHDLWESDYKEEEK